MRWKNRHSLSDLGLAGREVVKPLRASERGRQREGSWRRRKRRVRRSDAPTTTTPASAPRAVPRRLHPPHSADEPLEPLSLLAHLVLLALARIGDLLASSGKGERDEVARLCADVGRAQVRGALRGRDGGRGGCGSGGDGARVGVCERGRQGQQGGTEGRRGKRGSEDGPGLRTSLLPRWSATKTTPPMTTSRGGGCGLWVVSAGGAGEGRRLVGAEEGVEDGLAGSSAGLLRTRTWLRKPPTGVAVRLVGSVGAAEVVAEVEAPLKPGATQVALRWMVVGAPRALPRPPRPRYEPRYGGVEPEALRCSMAPVAREVGQRERDEDERRGKGVRTHW